jgi:L-amino acid N-acyltransferase YncA
MAPQGYPHTLALRDGTKIQIAILKQEEGKALHAFYRALPEEDRMVLKEDVRLAAWSERFLAKVAEGSIICLVATVEGEVVAEGSLYRTFHGWTRHVGEVRLTVGPAWRRKGLGRALATGLVKIATDLGIEKIIARVVENQVAAFHIFQRLGFMKEAVLHRHVTDLSGTKRDLLILANDVSQIWSTMEAMVMDFEPGGGA